MRRHRPRPVAGRNLAWDRPRAAVTLVIMRDDETVMLVGESFIGEGAEAAHINTMLGERAGPDAPAAPPSPPAAQ